MQKNLAARLDELHPAIKNRWSELLREAPRTQPEATGVVTPAMLILMVDETLERLQRTVRKSPRPVRSGWAVAHFGEMRAGCRCGLHLLQTYYLSGARALKEMLPDGLGVERVEVLHRFNCLAHEEMAALCEICRHRGGAGCSLQQKQAALAGLNEDCGEEAETTRSPSF